MGKTNFDELEVKTLSVEQGYTLTGDVDITGDIEASGDIASATGTFGKVSLSGVAAIATADATSTASTETVDPTEFAALVTLANACKAKINAIIAGS